MSQSNPKVLLPGQGFIRGTDLDEEIIGSLGDDTIRAGRGCDLVYGFAGDDIIDGQNGDDVVYGGEGTDDIAGGDGVDYLFGGDNVSLSGLLEELNGEDGDDILIGGGGNDRLVGGDDRDNESDNDYLVGTDYANAGVGEIDFLRGGDGADTFVLAEVKSMLEEEDPHGYREDELTGQFSGQRLYYLDDTANTNRGYAVIEDFRPNQGDKIRLLEQINLITRPLTYTVEPVTIGGVQGQGIYARTSPFIAVEPDLIAVVQFGGNSNRNLNLNSQYMDYVRRSFELKFPIDPFPIPLPASYTFD